MGTINQTEPYYYPDETIPDEDMIAMKLQEFTIRDMEKELSRRGYFITPKSVTIDPAKELANTPF